jgi:hypothetical protein
MGKKPEQTSNVERRVEEPGSPFRRLLHSVFGVRSSAFGVCLTSSRTKVPYPAAVAFGRVDMGGNCIRFRHGIIREHQNKSVAIVRH